MLDPILDAEPRAAVPIEKGRRESRLRIEPLPGRGDVLISAEDHSHDAFAPVFAPFFFGFAWAARAFFPHSMQKFASPTSSRPSGLWQ